MDRSAGCYRYFIGKEHASLSNPLAVDRFQVFSAKDQFAAVIDRNPVPDIQHGATVDINPTSVENGQIIYRFRFPFKHTQALSGGHRLRIRIEKEDRPSFELPCGFQIGEISETGTVGIINGYAPTTAGKVPVVISFRSGVCLDFPGAGKVSGINPDRSTGGSVVAAFLGRSVGGKATLDRQGVGNNQPNRPAAVGEGIPTEGGRSQINRLARRTINRFRLTRGSGLAHTAIAGCVVVYIVVSILEVAARSSAIKVTTASNGKVALSVGVNGSALINGNGFSDNCCPFTYPFAVNFFLVVVALRDNLPALLDVNGSIDGQGHPLAQLQKAGIENRHAVINSRRLPHLRQVDPTTDNKVSFSVCRILQINSPALGLPSSIISFKGRKGP